MYSLRGNKPSLSLSLSLFIFIFILLTHLGAFHIQATGIRSLVGPWHFPESDGLTTEWHTEHDGVSRFCLGDMSNR